MRSSIGTVFRVSDVALGPLVLKTFTLLILFVYLEFIVHSRIFHSYGDVTIAGEGLRFAVELSLPV